MNTPFLFIITCIVATFAFLGALSMTNPYPAFAVGFGAWILFFWVVAAREKNRQRRKQRERLLTSGCVGNSAGTIDPAGISSLLVAFGIELLAGGRGGTSTR